MKTEPTFVTLQGGPCDGQVRRFAGPFVQVFFATKDGVVEAANYRWTEDKDGNPRAKWNKRWSDAQNRKDAIRRLNFVLSEMEDELCLLEHHIDVAADRLIALGCLDPEWEES